MSTPSLQVQVEVPEVVEVSKRQQAVALARFGLRLLVSVVPSMLGAGLLGALKGVFGFGLAGLAVGVASLFVPGWMGSPPAPRWLTVLGVALPPLALALSGGYILMVQGATGRLAEEAQKRGLVRYLYAIIKPALVQAAKRLRGTGSLSRAELSRAIKHSVAEQVHGAMQAGDEVPVSFRQKVERFLMENSYRALGLVAVRAAVTAPDVPTAVKNLEEVGIERLELTLSETLEDLFFFQMILALLAGVLVAAAPTLLMVWLR